MDLKEQKYVCTLAECKSLTRASERLYISQPALSLYINNVEKNLGAPLFKRNGRKFELTWLGKQYVEKASQMLELERQFEAVMRQTEQESAGQVRIGIAQRRGIWFLPAVLSVYEREWPQVDVVIREGNLADLTIMLKNRELDLVVLSQSDVTSEVETIPLGMEDFLLMVSGDHPLNEKAVPVEGSKLDFLDPHLLSGETIFLNTEMQSARRVEEKILKDYKVKPGRIRVVRNMELGAQLVAEGLGVGFIRQGYQKNIHYPKPVKYYTIDSSKYGQNVVVAYRQDVELTKPMRAMIMQMKDAAEEYLEF